jgi:ADP-heptose:LPS heptosyltransferase
VTAALVSQLSGWQMIQAGVRQILRSVTQRGLPIGRSPDGSVIIHPGAGKPEKCWPLDRFVKLAEHLKKKHIPVRVLLGEVELEKWPPELIEKISHAAEVRKPATFLDLLKEIAPASLFLGNDSGPAHLAAISGIPTLALFGTQPDRWKPIGPKVEVIHRDSIDSISVHDVESTITKQLHG